MKCPSGNQYDYTCYVGEKSKNPNQVCAEGKIVSNSEVEGTCVGPSKAKATCYYNGSGCSAPESPTPDQGNIHSMIEPNTLSGGTSPASEMLTNQTPISEWSFDQTQYPAQFEGYLNDVYSNLHAEFNATPQLPMSANANQPTFGAPSSGQIGDINYSPITAPQEQNDTQLIAPNDAARLSPDVTSNPDVAGYGQFTDGRYVPPLNSPTFQSNTNSGAFQPSTDYVAPVTNTFQPPANNTWDNLPDVQSSNIEDRRGDVTPLEYSPSELQTFQDDAWALYQAVAQDPRSPAELSDALNPVVTVAAKVGSAVSGLFSSIQKLFQ